MGEGHGLLQGVDYKSRGMKSEAEERKTRQRRIAASVRGYAQILHVDWESTSKEYWRYIYKRIEDARERGVITEEWPKGQSVSYKLRQLRHHQRRATKRAGNWHLHEHSSAALEKRYGRMIASLICLKMGKLVDEKDNLSNIRVARCSSRTEMKRYGRQKEQGCCGFFDQKFKIGGRYYMIGFNYGH